jgi:hypothetical protein
MSSSHFGITTSASTSCAFAERRRFVAVPRAGSPPWASGSKLAPSPSILIRGAWTAGSFAYAATAAFRSSSVKVAGPVLRTYEPVRAIGTPSRVVISGGIYAGTVARATPERVARPSGVLCEVGPMHRQHVLYRHMPARDDHERARRGYAIYGPL